MPDTTKDKNTIYIMRMVLLTLIIFFTKKALKMNNCIHNIHILVLIIIVSKVLKKVISGVIFLHEK